MAVLYSFFEVFLVVHRRPTIRQALGEGPPPQTPRRPGQPPDARPGAEAEVIRVAAVLSS